MTILEGDIKIMASQVLADVPEGGGAATGTVIQDGVSNNLFPDISELDRVYGNVSLRKVFVGVRTPNVDGYYGSNMIVAEPPNDPDVSCVLFSTGDSFDTRTSAAARIEAYLSQGPSYQGQLYGNHIAGQMNVMLIQRVGVTLPVIGDTLVLRKNEGLSTQVEQFVRIRDVSSIERTFTDSQGRDFTRTVVTTTISDQLGADYPGFEAVYSDANISYEGKTKVYETIVADAARYYGVAELEVDALATESSVKAASSYAQLVPSGRSETAIADARMNQQVTAALVAGSAYSTTVTAIFDATHSLYVGGGILPGTLSVARSGVTVTDSGGKLYSDVTEVGAIDYGNGVLTLGTSVFGTGAGAHDISYVPAASATIVSESIGLQVTQEGQRLSYVVTLNPIPTKGSTQISYRAQGRWYTLLDDGSGAIKGSDSALGAGSLNFTTGTLTITLGALPDVGSQIIVGFAGSSLAKPLTALPAAMKDSASRFRKVIDLAKAIKPGTLSITWNDGLSRTAEDDPNTSTLTGDAAGKVYYSSGRIEFSPNTLPAKGTSITVAITDSTQATSTVSAFTDSGSSWSGSFGGAVTARTVEMSVVAQHPLRKFPGVDETAVTLVRVFDNGTGTLQIVGITGNINVGTINYTNGNYTINKSIANYESIQSIWEMQAPWGTAPEAKYIKLTGQETRSVTLTMLNGTSTAVTAPAWAWFGTTQTAAANTRYGTVDGAVTSVSFDLNEIFMPASGYYYQYAVGSVVSNYTSDTRGFVLGAKAYTISRTNQIFTDVSANSGVGIAVGAYGQGVEGLGSRLSEWTPGAASQVSVQTGVVVSPVTGTSSDMLVDAAVFRTASSPIANGSFSVVGNFQDGVAFNATADSSGNIVSGSAVSGSTPGSYGVFGSVDYEFGVITLRFGRRVPSSMASDPGVVDLTFMGIPGVSYVQSKGAQADTLRYNATAYVYTPLSPSILGLNPVRLPSDGRVPIFRSGSVVVVHNTKTTTPATVSNGQTINCARTRLAKVRVVGANGNTITAGYTTNLDAGTVTFTNVTGYSQPVSVEHRVEDMAMVSDSQITGLLRLNRPLTHDYDAGESYVSSALIMGNLQARVSKLFDQASWNGTTWSDDQSGDAASATFDAINYPPVVTNESAITERWALKFTGSTAYNIIGEHLGLIGTGSTAADCAPINPATGDPYFTLDHLGFGNGWSVGNTIRINTVGALPPIWVARVIKPGVGTEIQHQFTLAVRGDIDRP